MLYGTIDETDCRVESPALGDHHIALGSLHLAALQSACWPAPDSPEAKASNFIYDSREPEIAHARVKAPLPEINLASAWRQSRARMLRR